MSKLILSIDGGGVRSGASMQFLLRLEQSLKSKGLGSLRDYIDLYAGSSAGAIIALALSNTDEAIHRISHLFGYANGQRIYSPNFLGQLSRGLFAPRYRWQGKAETIASFFNDAKLSANRYRGEALVLSYDLSTRRAAVFKTYSSNADHLRCADIADASSATPTLFASRPIQFDPFVPSHWFVDGGIVANNPTLCAIAEAKVLWPDQTKALRVLSLGAGVATNPIDAPTSPRWGSAQWLSRGHLVELFSDETLINFQSHQLVESGCYIRVNSIIQSQPGMKHPPAPAMDLPSQNNIERIIQMGDFWFERYGEAVIEFITGSYSGPSLNRIDPATGQPKKAFK